MPLNTLRLNEKHLHPNQRITFIKSIPNRTTTQKAELFLQKVAAICYPIMKAHHLSITTLEEFPPNREFMGRNFNGGEVIQLVLRRMPDRKVSAAQRYGASATNGVANTNETTTGISIQGNQGRLDPHSSDLVAEDDDGGWLDFRCVTMVMMHELAHCIQMNHSKAFWAVRNEYAEHLKVLWSRGYTGEGVWGRGQALHNGEFEGRGRGGSDCFADLCGGAYRGRRGRRGRSGAKEKVSYAERKKRKLEKTEKKFGKGAAVGENESLKVMLEGKMIGSKPRVANSKRGRELRANAALARFAKGQSEASSEASDAVEEDETEDDSGSETDPDLASTQLVDSSGRAVTDGKGNKLYRVCDDGDPVKDQHAQDEFKELLELDDPDAAAAAAEPSSNHNDEDETDDSDGPVPIKVEPDTVKNGERSLRTEAADEDSDDLDTPIILKGSTMSLSDPAVPASRSATTQVQSPRLQTRSLQSTRGTSKVTDRTCPICSLINEPSVTTCQACSHVMCPDSDAAGSVWTCQTESCKEIGYVNSGDTAICGLCGARRATSGSAV